MRSTRTTVLVLAALVGVWALIFGLRRSDEPVQTSVPPQTAARPARTSASPSATTPRLKAELVNLPRAPYPSEVQNIFSAAPPPPPPLPPPAVGPPGSAQPALPPPDPFQEEAKQLRYVGFLKSGNVLTAFIVQGQAVHTVPVGGMLHGRFRVAEVQEESVLLTSPSGDKQARLGLWRPRRLRRRAPGAPRRHVLPAHPVRVRNEGCWCWSTTHTVESRRGTRMKTPYFPEIRRLALPLLLGSLLAGCAMQFPITRGEELAQQGRWEEAIPLFQEAAKQDPKNLEARLGLARALWMASQDFVRQGNEFERVDRLDDASVAYRRALGYNGENQLALAGLERIARKNDIQDRLKLARERMVKKEWGGARLEVQTVLRLDPENAEAKALKKEIAALSTAEAPPSKVDADTEKAAQHFFHTKPVTLRFKDTDIKEVLEVISRTAGVNIVTDESLQPKRITAFLKDVPLREAFMLILTSNRLFAKRAAENTVIVVPDNPGKRQQYDELAVQTFYLTDADAKVTVNLLRTILNTRQVFVNEKLNALVVRETPEKIELARKVLEANDRSVGEVEIDLEVLEVDRTAAQNLGLDFSPRTLSVTLNFPQAIPVTGFWDAIRTGSTVSITNPTLILNLVKNDSTTKVLANPTVRILDRQKARLLIGQRRPFLISSISSVPSVSGGTVGTTTGDHDHGRRDHHADQRGVPGPGPQDDAHPHRAPRRRGHGGDQLRDQRRGSRHCRHPGRKSLAAREHSESGHVHQGAERRDPSPGGLYQEDASVATSKMPFLSEVPLVGRLFMSPNEQRSRTDVLISLTPRIVKTMNRPDADIESFTSGTADSFGPAAPSAPGGVVAPPRPALPTPQPSGQPGGPGAPGASGPGPRP